MKIINKTDAVHLIKDNDTLALAASGTWSVPEVLLTELEEVYHKEKHPKNITLSTGISPGPFTYEKFGANHLTEKGLIGKLISSHIGACKLFEECITKNQFPAYTIPFGVYLNLLRATASKESGYLTRIGLSTFADPRKEGCRANKKATEEIVQLVNLNGQEQLLYKTYPIDICFIKATLSDREGNISLSKEILKGEQLELAAATHNSGGIVVVEVSKIVNRIPVKDVAIHKSLVDYVVVCKDTYTKECKRTYSKLVHPKIRWRPLTTLSIMQLDARKICARRAFLELNKNSVINLGVGMPEGVASIAREEKFVNDITLSVELGALGGVPLSGRKFGVSHQPEAIMSSVHTMNLYDGGFLDVAILGLAEMDKEGNVNVSKFNKRLVGPGGFIDISQTTRKIIFVGTFTSVHLKVKVIDQKLVILEEGKTKKLKEKVEQITFSAKEALKNHQEVYYVTERAVFKLTQNGVTLIEIAPGIDLDKDILSLMEFKPIISNDLKLMDEKIFKESKMNLSSYEINNIAYKKKEKNTLKGYIRQKATKYLELKKANSID